MADLPSIDDANVRGPAYYVASARVNCQHCGIATVVMALAVPHDHETRQEDGDIEPWQRVSVAAMLFYVTSLPIAVQARLSRLSSRYQPASSDAALGSYWSNHCDHCGVLLGDHDLHCEPDGAFVPSSAAQAQEIQILRIPEPFEAAATGYALEPEFFEFMRKA